MIFTNQIKAMGGRIDRDLRDLLLAMAAHLEKDIEAAEPEPTPPVAPQPVLFNGEPNNISDASSISTGTEGAVAGMSAGSVAGAGGLVTGDLYMTTQVLMVKT